MGLGVQLLLTINRQLMELKCNHELILGSGGYKKKKKKKKKKKFTCVPALFFVILHVFQLLGLIMMDHRHSGNGRNSQQ